MSTSLPQTEFGETASTVVDELLTQRQRSESEYLELTDSTNHLIELVDGYIEALPMPTRTHQDVAAFIYDALRDFVTPDVGKVRFAAYRVRIREATFREPDVYIYLQENLDQFRDRYGGPPDLAVEIVSDDAKSRIRDYQSKRTDYAGAGVREYWIVDPAKQLITVLTLDGESYVEHGAIKPGETATSKLLEGFAVAVDDVFAAANT